MAKLKSLDKNNFIQAAYSIIKEGGIDALSLNVLAKHLGCAKGTFYTYYESMDDLILDINSITLKQIQEVISQTVGQGKSVRETMVDVCMNFISFAEENENIWRLLFEYRVSNDENLPEWVEKEIHNVFTVVADYLSEYYKDEQKGKEVTAVLWATLHGLISLHINKKLITVTDSKVGDLSNILLDELFNEI